MPKPVHKSALTLAIILALSACSKAPEPDYSASASRQSMSDGVMAENTASSAVATDETTQGAVLQKDNQTLHSQATDQSTQAHLTDKQFIVNTQAQFGVADVVKTVDALESLTLNMGGYIQKTHIYNDTTSKESYPVGDGNIKTLTHFVRRSQMIVRIPKARVGEFLKGVQGQVVFLDTQEYTAKDVALDLQREYLLAQIEAQKQADLARLNATKTDDLADQSAHVDSMAQSKHRQMLAQLDRQALAEQVAFSTVALNFYQNPQILEHISPDTQAYIAKDKRANFGHKLVQSLSSGWGYFLNILLWLASLWAFILGALVFWVLWRFGISKWWTNPIKKPKTPKDNRHRHDTNNSQQP